MQSFSNFPLIFLLCNVDCIHVLLRGLRNPQHKSRISSQNRMIFYIKIFKTQLPVFIYQGVRSDQILEKMKKNFIYSLYCAHKGSFHVSAPISENSIIAFFLKTGVNSSRYKIKAQIQQPERRTRVRQSGAIESKLSGMRIQDLSDQKSTTQGSSELQFNRYSRVRVGYPDPYLKFLDPDLYPEYRSGSGTMF